MESRNSAPLASYMDLLLDAVCAVDRQGRFVFVSAACERIFGYTPEELIGRSMIELVHPADRQRTLAAAHDIMGGEPKHNFENRYVRKDGRIVNILWSARWSEVDQLRIAVARDITERKQAESRQAALYAISEAAHVAEDLLALFKRIHLIIGEWLPALNFSVALYDEHCAQLNFPYHVDDHELQPEQPGTVTGRLCTEVIRSGQPILLTPDSPDASPDFAALVAGQDSPCWLGVPLNSKNGTIGALIVKSLPGGERYTEQDKELLQYVCAQVATAIERQQLHARLKRMAQYDQLTQLPNRGLLKSASRLRWPVHAKPRETWRCCTSIWIASNRSTTPLAMRSATCCCKRWRVGSRAAYATPIPWRASVATNSWCCCTAFTPLKTPTSWLEKSARYWCNRCAWTVTTCTSNRASAWPAIPNMAARSSNCSGMPTRRCTPPNASIIGRWIAEPVRAVRRGAGNFSKPLAVRQFSI